MEMLEYIIEWQGIAISITHRKGWPINNMNHIEIKAGQRLPITETGYRSHYIPDAALVGFDDALDYVSQWLNVASQSKEWKRYVESLRQPSLFDFD